MAKTTHFFRSYASPAKRIAELCWYSNAWHYRAEDRRTKRLAKSIFTGENLRLLRGRHIHFFIPIMLLLGCALNTGGNKGAQIPLCLSNISMRALNTGENKGEPLLVRQLDVILLTADDLPPRLTLKTSHSFYKRGASLRVVGFSQSWGAADPDVVGFSQLWVGDPPEERIAVTYWLFESADAAEKSTELVPGVLVSEGIYQREIDAEAIIGDLTWCGLPPDNASLWFVKNNVLVFINPSGTFDQLRFTRAVARKIEAEIASVLQQKDL